MVSVPSQRASSDPSRVAERVLLLAPTGRDARVLGDLLRTAGLQAAPCSGATDLVERLREGAGCVLLTPEALVPACLSALLAALGTQPPWSDVPLLVLADVEVVGTAAGRAVAALRAAANVTVLERPVRALPLLTAVQSALRARRRQYQIRDLVRSERSARDDAEAASRLKDEFLATVTHELRTPLNSISLWVRLLLRGGLAPEKVTKGLAAIERSADSTSQLVDDLLDVARMRAGNLRLTLAQVDLASVLGAAVEVVRPALEAKGIRIEQRIDPIEPLRADASRLQQVVWNLVNNAVKFTPRGGTITLALSRRGQEAILEVSDTGEGISPDFLPFVFDRFRQGDARVQREHGGLGLGLAITRQLVELHGGSIRVESEGRGRGARFVVTLPFGQAGAHTQS